jgi:hypothetical protein
LLTCVVNSAVANCSPSRSVESVMKNGGSVVAGSCFFPAFPLKPRDPDSVQHARTAPAPRGLCRANQPPRPNVTALHVALLKAMADVATRTHGPAHHTNPRSLAPLPHTPRQTTAVSVPRYTARPTTHWRQRTPLHPTPQQLSPRGPPKVVNCSGPALARTSLIPHSLVAPCGPTMSGADGASAVADPVGYWASRLDDVGSLKLPSDHTQTDQVRCARCKCEGGCMAWRVSKCGTCLAPLPAPPLLAGAPPRSAFADLTLNPTLRTTPQYAESEEMMELKDTTCMSILKLTMVRLNQSRCFPHTRTLQSR